MSHEDDDGLLLEFVAGVRGDHDRWFGVARRRPDIERVADALTRLLDAQPPNTELDRDLIIADRDRLAREVEREQKWTSMQAKTLADITNERDALRARVEDLEGLRSAQALVSGPRIEALCLRVAEAAFELAWEIAVAVEVPDRAREAAHLDLLVAGVLSERPQHQHEFTAADPFKCQSCGMNREQISRRGEPSPEPRARGASTATLRTLHEKLSHPCAHSDRFTVLTPYCLECIQQLVENH